MRVTNALRPTEEQLRALLDGDLEGPVSMLNLLKFKERAEYEDGRATSLTGWEAYQRYGDQMRAFVESKGGRFIFAGHVRHLMLGAVDGLWDTAAIVEYPSKEAFVEIISSPEVAGFAVHRTAGLEGQLLIAITAAVT